MLDCGTFFLMAGKLQKVDSNCEFHTETAEAMILIAFIQIMLNKFIE